MTDRENVIKGLECCTGDLSCTKCPYHEEEYCRSALEQDALKLLKSNRNSLTKSRKGGQTMGLSIDREKVIKGLSQHCEGSMFDRCGECPYYEVADKPFNCRDAILMDVLALLKEQPEIVRCRNCRHYNTECCSDGYGWCHRRDFGTNDEWYCADGEAGIYATD